MFKLASGAKGIDTFTESIKKNYLPKESSLEHEGLFSDYYFETANESEKLFKANFNYAVTVDPIHREHEYYISIGMASCLDGDGLQKHGGRPLLNLVIILDTSGSMRSSFYGESKGKLEVAKDSILALLTHLVSADQFCLLTFDTSYHVIQEPSLWGNIDQTKLKTQILALQAGGGTSLTAGMQGCTEMIHKMLSNQPKSTGSSQYYENRIMYLTDMVPSSNDSDGTKLFQMCTENSTHNIYTTFIGIGVDFNTDIVALIGKIRACNYYSVKSARDFKKTMDEDFEYIVTPSVFDINIEVDEKSLQEWEPIRVFGSPGHEIPEHGRLTFIESTFPSQKQSDTMTKGGMVLVKLNKKNFGNTESELHLKVRYKDRLGQQYKDSDVLKLQNHSEDYFQTISIRKAILLTRYVNFFKNYLTDVRNKKDHTPTMNSTVGICAPPVERIKTDQSVQQMRELTAEYRPLFDVFIDYFSREMTVIDDPQLERELQPLVTISTFTGK